MIENSRVTTEMTSIFRPPISYRRNELCKILVSRCPLLVAVSKQLTLHHSLFYIFDKLAFYFESKYAGKYQMPLPACLTTDIEAEIAIATLYLAS